MGGTSRDEEREKRWRRNKELREKRRGEGGGAVVSVREIDKSIADFFKRHWQADWKEARRARGPEIVRELLRLAVEQNDKRFVAPIEAMIDHQLLNENYGFMGRHAPGRTDLKRQISVLRQQQDDEQIERVHLLHDQGVSIREASKKVAEDAGRPNYSFEAAHAQLRNRVKRAPKRSPPKSKGG
jgi:hypothetical protein